MDQFLLKVVSKAMSFFFFFTIFIQQKMMMRNEFIHYSYDRQVTSNGGYLNVYL